MTDLGVFGPMLDGSDVERALLEHLEEWMPTYVPAVARMKDPEGERWPNGVAPVRSFTVVHAAEEKWPEDQIPMLLAYSPGLLEEAYTAGDGEVIGKYGCAIAAIAGADTIQNTKELARVYATAAKAAILQHESLGGFALGTDWTEERNYPVLQGVDLERNLMAVSALYVVEVERMLDKTKGPDEPLADPDTPPPDLGKVKEGGGHVEIEQELAPKA